MLCVENPNTKILSWERDPVYICESGRRCLYSSLTANDGATIPRFPRNITCVYKLKPNLAKGAGNPTIRKTIDNTEKSCPTPITNYDFSKMETDYDGGDTNTWFTLNKYIKTDHQTNGMNHGSKESFGGVEACGYFADMPGGCQLYFKRKFLKSYSCNDGTWSADWNNSDKNYSQSCNGTSGGDWETSNWNPCTRDRINEEDVPASAYLGSSYSNISNKNDMFTRSHSLFPNPKGSCATCIGSPPKTPEQIAAEAAAAAVLEEEKQRATFGGGGY
jgi:hypothetical protein